MMSDGLRVEPLQGGQDKSSDSDSDLSFYSESSSDEEADKFEAEVRQALLSVPPVPDNWDISGEFHSIEKETSPSASKILVKPDARRNRYPDVLPLESTRVKLKGADSDYINANFIQGEQGIVYIAAQAPLPSTFADFWLMIYEQKTRVIMMLTRLQEQSRKKADIYWPHKGLLQNSDGGFDPSPPYESYGPIEVTQEEMEKINPEITVRSFRVRHKDFRDVEHKVVQIHYTGWPDFGTPKSGETFKLLLELMEKHNSEKVVESDAIENGPIVTHCSAGLGRTGTLIAAHIAAEQLRMGKAKPEISMKKIVKALRGQRAGMVQTSAQYKFLHSMLKEL